MYKGRRVRGIKFSPILFIPLGLVAVAAGAYMIWRAVNGPAEPNVPNIPDVSDGAQDGGADAGNASNIGTTDGGSGEPGKTDGPLAEHITTASGIPCTLTDLGEDAIYTGELILVNNKVPYHFPEFQNLVNIYDEKTDSYYVRDMEVQLSPVALDALNRMMDDFREQGGSRTINVVAGYRTEEVQQHLFDQSAERNGLDHAEKFVAKPGGSEHHTGYVVDFSIFNSEDGTSRDYDGTGEYAWINENCQNYGYVVRYDVAKADLTGISEEPWHFRYLGIPHATEIVNQEMCLEEYTDYLRQFPFDGDHLSIKCEDGEFEVWYCQGHQVYLPDSGDYSVSGNNVDGVIVTYRK